MTNRRPVALDHTHEQATESYDGFFSKSDKSTLNALASAKNLSVVSHDATLSGDGTAGNALSVVNDGHTHDDRYFTETEVGVLLSGKSNTTHNHDLTYAPLVHNHDDIYYTDDEVDTLLLSKSDTTHTHDLIKNATEANAKIEASSTGAVITRNVNDANAVLKVNQQNASSTGNILDLQFGGVSKAYVSRTGNITAGYLFTPNGMGNSTTMNNAIVSVPSTGTLISRNVADTNPAVKVNLAHASSTGNIAEFQFNGTTKLAINKTGLIPQEAWITPTLTNSWATLVDPTLPPKYFKDTLGIVHLKGKTENGTSNTSAFTLPVGYRPSGTLRFICASRAGINTAFAVDITGTGEVKIIRDATSDRWVDLSSINFRAEQ